MTYLAIYLVGYVLSYYSLKYVYLHCHQDEEWDWVSVKDCTLLSIFSYLLLMITLIIWAVQLIKFLDNKIKLPKSKPPKWL